MKGFLNCFGRKLRRRLSLCIKGEQHPPGYEVSFSQTGEDRILYFICSSLGKWQPTYLDIGSHHPTFASNSFLFDRLGARGVCVEPNPGMRPLYSKMRPATVLVNAAVGAGGTLETISYFEFAPPHDAFNTTSTAFAAHYQALGIRVTKQSEVPFVSLQEIYSQHFGAVGPHILLIDVEGSEVSILQGLREITHRPAVICAETLRYDAQGGNFQDAEVEKLLEDLGYRKFAHTGINGIFVLKDVYQRLLRI